MKVSQFFQIKWLNIPAFWLIAIAGSLIAIHLALNLRAERYSHLALSVVFWLAASSILWDKRKHLKLGSGIASCLLGALFIIGILLKSTAYPEENFLGFFPIISMFSLALLASGFQGLKQYRQELIILFTFAIPKLLLPFLPDISPITAKFSAFLLWYSGTNAVLQGSHIILSQGIVEVVPACSGLNLILYMFGLAVIALVMFPTYIHQRIIIPIVAVTLGFLVNSFRVAILANLVAPSSQDAFKYWHSQEGGLIFIMVSVILFGIYCFYFIHPPFPKQSKKINNIHRHSKTLKL
ncbi:MAG: cyanoexosortase A [Limnoraphis sp. WC205]|jgi:cyanoexosortase A|nr:cyanoexosortase A [Limnoraphis sp. WC205]